MKKKTIFLFILIFTSASFFLIFNYYHQKKSSVYVTTSNLNTPIQSDLFITFEGSENSKDLINVDKKILNEKGEISVKEKIDINDDGKIVLKVKINNKSYKSTIIPYVTKGNTVSVLKISLSEKKNNITIIGKYVTLLEGEKEINNKLEKVESYENKK